MNDETMQVDIETFPDYPTTYIKIEPLEPKDNSSFYEIEIPKDELSLAKFLRRLRPNIDLETPIVSFKSFAREAFASRVCSCYCSHKNLSNIIELYHDRVVTPEKEFPGSGEGDKSEVFGALYPGVDQAFITENIRIIKDTYLQERLIKGNPDGNTIIKFFYKGPL